MRRHAQAGMSEAEVAATLYPSSGRVEITPRGTIRAGDFLALHRDGTVAPWNHGRTVLIDGQPVAWDLMTETGRALYRRLYLDDITAVLPPRGGDDDGR